MADIKRAKTIAKKRNIKKLTDDETDYLMNSLSKPDAGIIQEETAKLTKEMSGCTTVLPWPEEWIHVITDNIGTTGVKSVVNLVLAPALAAVGFKVPVISGQSLNYTGKFANYLECLPGFRVCLSLKSICEILNSTGCCIVGKTVDFDPADKILCQCQEISEMTGKVKYPPLIVATIVSKNCCEEITALLYDVKYGTGSLFSTKTEAKETARNLVQKSKCKKTTALLSSMEHSYGRYIGNSAEIAEAILCLKGRGSSDVIRFACALGSELLQLVRGASKEAGTMMIMDVIQNGTALEKFRKMIIHQGVQPEKAHLLCTTKNVFFNLPKTPYETDIVYDGEEGFVQEINLLNLAMIYKEVSAKCNHDPGVGLKLRKYVGDKIKSGEVWIKISHQRKKIKDEIKDNLKKSISVGQNQEKRILIDRKLFSSDKFLLIEENYNEAVFGCYKKWKGLREIS